MTPEQRRAHLILIGQPLLYEWQDFCRAWDVALTGYDAGTALDAWDNAVWHEYATPGEWAGPDADDYRAPNGDYYTCVVPNNLPGEKP